MELRHHIEALQAFADMVRDKLPDKGVATFDVDLIRQLVGTIDALASDERSR